MRTVVYSLSVFCLLAIGLYSAFAKPPATAPQRSTFGQTGSAGNDPFFSGPRQPASRESQRHMQHAADYVQLADQFAKLLDEDELATETQELERKLSVKRSAISLESVRQQLTEIIDKYPSTPSAEQAQRLLNNLNAPPMDATEEEGSEADLQIDKGEALPTSAEPNSAPAEFQPFGQQ